MSWFGGVCKDPPKLWCDPLLHLWSSSFGVGVGERTDSSASLGAGSGGSRQSWLLATASAPPGGLHILGVQ